MKKKKERDESEKLKMPELKRPLRGNGNFGAIWKTASLAKGDKTLYNVNDSCSDGISNRESNKDSETSPK